MGDWIEGKRKGANIEIDCSGFRSKSRFHSSLLHYKQLENLTCNDTKSCNKSPRQVTSFYRISVTSFYCISALKFLGDVTVNIT